MIGRRARLLVYGTLRIGGVNGQLMSAAKHIREARTAPLYELVSLGWYPALCEPGQTAVVGDLFEVPEPLWRELDAYEDCPNLYTCRPVKLANGAVAHAYFLNAPPPADAPRIESGDWLSHRSERST